MIWFEWIDSDMIYESVTHNPVTSPVQTFLSLFQPSYCPTASLLKSLLCFIKKNKKKTIEWNIWPQYLTLNFYL